MPQTSWITLVMRLRRDDPLHDELVEKARTNYRSLSREMGWRLRQSLEAERKQEREAA